MTFLKGTLDRKVCTLKVAKLDEVGLIDYRPGLSTTDFWGRYITDEPKNLSVQLPLKLSIPYPIFQLLQKFVQLQHKFVQHGHKSLVVEENFTQ